MTTTCSGLTLRMSKMPWYAVTLVMPRGESDAYGLPGSSLVFVSYSSLETHSNLHCAAVNLRVGNNVIVGPAKAARHNVASGVLLRLGGEHLAHGGAAHRLTGSEGWTVGALGVGTSLDHTTLSGVIGEVVDLDQDLAVLDLWECSFFKAEGVWLDRARGRVGEDPDLAAGGKRHDSDDERECR